MSYIFFSGNILERAGGPSTYLYNLKEGLEKRKEKSIKFIYNKDLKNNSKKKIIAHNKEMLANIFPKLYEEIMLNHILSEGKYKNELVTMSNVDLMHFHLTSDLAKYYKYLHKNTIKVLTTHCPEMPCIEFKNSLKAKAKMRKYNFDKAENIFFEYIDKVAFEQANVIIFPSKEAMEPYYETCDTFQEIIESKKIKYLFTGTKPLKYNKENKVFREEYGIPDNAFVISFVGRHNEVKGYDNFIQIGKKLLQNKKDIYIITAGVGNIKSPSNNRWIDIGWTDDPGSIVNASNVFILPNKRTYFDLVLLEVLSIGKTCIVSNTGGNKTVSKLTEGVIGYNTIDEAVNKIRELYNNKEKLLEYEKINKKVYNKYFTVEKFTENYIKLINEIKVEENKNV